MGGGWVLDFIIFVLYFICSSEFNKVWSVSVIVLKYAKQYIPKIITAQTKKTKYKVSLTIENLWEKGATATAILLTSK